MKKNIFCFIIIFSLCFFINTSELRLRSISGISPNGLYIAKDSWCDAFYLNPVYASFNDKIIINTNNTFNINFNKYEEINNNSTNTINNNNLDFNNNFKFGILIPNSKFLSFGVYSSIYGLYNKNINENKYNNSGKYFHLDNSIDKTITLDNNALFSWNISKITKFGFKTGIITKFVNTDYSLNNYSGSPYSDEHRHQYSINYNEIYNITYYTDFGFGFDFELFKISLLIPISGNFYSWRKNYIEYEYDFDSFLGISERTSNYNEYSSYENYIISGGIKNLFDITFSKKFLLRLPFESIFTFSNINSDSRIFNENLINKIYNLNIKTAFGINQQLNDKVLFIYGIDSKYIMNYNYSYHQYYDNIDDYFLKNQSQEFHAGIFLGGEFSIIKWLTLRLGIQTNFLNYIYTNKCSHPEKHEISENNDDDYISESFNLFADTNFSVGLSFNPSEKCSIELTTNFLALNFGFNKENNTISRNTFLSGNKYNNLENKFSLTFELGLLFNFNYKKSENSAATSSIM